VYQLTPKNFCCQQWQPGPQAPTIRRRGKTRAGRADSGRGASRWGEAGERALIVLMWTSCPTSYPLICRSIAFGWFTRLHVFSLRFERHRAFKFIRINENAWLLNSRVSNRWQIYMRRDLYGEDDLIDQNSSARFRVTTREPKLQGEDNVKESDYDSVRPGTSGTWKDSTIV
jgi:hypothetical protein